MRSALVSSRLRWKQSGADLLRSPRPESASPVIRRFGQGAVNTAMTVGIVAFWAFWVAHAMVGFWLILILITLPLAIRLTRRAVENLLRPPGFQEVAHRAPSVLAVCIERGVRAALIIVAVAVLAWGWGIDLTHLHGQDAWVSRLADGVLNAIVILLVADFLWQAVKTAIDRKLTEVADLGLPNTDERGARPYAHAAADFSQHSVRGRYRHRGDDDASCIRR